MKRPSVHAERLKESFGPYGKAERGYIFPAHASPRALIQILEATEPRIILAPG